MPNALEQPLVKLLEKLLEKSQEKSQEKNLGKLAKEFTIEKFGGKNSKANQWINNFEKECARFEITIDEKKIEILKSFIEKGAVDWYSCALLKLTIETEWEEWKTNFCNTFDSKGWSPIKYALSFKYQTGSLLEYSIKKEDRIDRGKLTKTEDFHNEIGKLEHLTYKKNLEFKKDGPKIKDKSKKTPCEICKKKGTRFHPEAECWFKDQEDKNNKTKQVNTLTLNVELSDDDPKN